MNADYRFPGITLAHLAAECAREITHRRALYTRRVDSGRMLRQEADHGIALAGAWAEDVARMIAQDQVARIQWDRFLSGQPANFKPAPPEHSFTWTERRQGLLRELDYRRRFYPEWISAGRLLQADATHRIGCAACLLTLYEDGWDWRGSDGLLPGKSAQAKSEYLALLAEIAAREGTAQKEMSL